MQTQAPFHTTYRPGEYSTPYAPRPVLSRALRADLVTPAPGPVLVWGEPKIGKTSVLRQVLWSLDPSQFLVARIPIGALAHPVGEQSRFARILAGQISIQLQSAGMDARELAHVRDVPRLLNELLSLSRRAKRFPVVVIEGVDRYEKSVRPPGVGTNLSLVLGLLPHISLVLTSRRPLPSLHQIRGRPHVRVHFVPPLSDNASRRLLTGPVDGHISFKPDCLERLVESAGGRPFLLQIMGRNCTRLAAQRRQAHVGLAETREVLSSCWLAGEPIFRPLLAQLPSDRQQVVAAVALGTSERRPVLSFEEVYKILHKAGARVSLSGLGQNLAQLNEWRILASPDEGQHHHVSCGWLASYLRVGAFA